MASGHTDESLRFTLDRLYAACIIELDGDELAKIADEVAEAKAALDSITPDIPR